MQFKLTTSLLLTLLPLLFALPEPPTKIAIEAPISDRDEPGSLVARACTNPATKYCTSLSGASDGKYCGFCHQVQGYYIATDIYQVNGESGRSSCCDYGHSSHCAAHWPAVSPNVNVNCRNNGDGY